MSIWNCDHANSAGRYSKAIESPATMPLNQIPTRLQFTVDRPSLFAVASS